MDEPPAAAISPAPAMSEIDNFVRKAEQQARQLVALKEATSSFVRRDARLSQLREKTLLLRSRAKFEWKNCHDYRRFVRQSQEAFNEEAAVIMSPSATEDYSVRLERLQGLHDQVMRDFEAQNEYAERANALQTELSGVEYDLQTREVSVKNAADLMKVIISELVLPGDSGTVTAVDTEVPLSPSIQPSEDLDPLMENYFSKAGIVNNLMEHSIELEVEYAEARGEREFKAEHDQNLDTSDVEFEAEWQQKRSEHSYQLAEARRVANTARIACLDNGLNPDKHRNRPRRDSDRSISDSIPDEISRILPLDIDFQVLGDPSYAQTRSSSNDGKGAYPILTPKTLPTLASRGPRAEAEIPAFLEDRVLDWIYDVQPRDNSSNEHGFEAQRPDLLPRRSVSDSSPLKQLHRFQQHPSWPGFDVAREQYEISRLSEVRRNEDAERRRRRSSDSNMPPHHEGIPIEHLRR